MHAAKITQCVTHYTHVHQARVGEAPQPETIQMSQNPWVFRAWDNTDTQDVLKVEANIREVIVE